MQFHDDQLNSNWLQNPMKPDSKLVIDETELRQVLMDIAQEIERLKPGFPHLVGFTVGNAVSLASRIWYRNNIQQKPNPEYEKEIKKRESLEPIKRPLPPKAISVYPEEDGIELFIVFTSYDEYLQNQRIKIPELWIANHAVELTVKGAKTLKIKELHGKIFAILVNTKKQVEKET